MPAEQRDAGTWMHDDQTQGTKTDHSARRGCAVGGYTGRRAAADFGVGEPVRLEQAHVDGSGNRSAGRTMACIER
jgi:hypothetical protein